MTATPHRVWRLGPDIDTDQLAPGAYMKLGIEGIAPHCLEGTRPGFAAQVRPGDVIAAGPNFGIGSSREQAAGALAHLGVRAVIAPSFGGLYFRNAFNLGLLLLTCAEAESLSDAEQITLDLQRLEVNTASGRTLKCEPIPGFLLDMVAAGGLMNQLRQRLRGPAPSSATLVRGQNMPEDTPHVPVVIVGGGACGMTAAVRLRSAEVDCVVLERDAVARGSTALSSGFIPAAGTRLQKALGIHDSRELFATDIQAKAHGDAAPHLVDAYTRGVAEAIDALEARGITFEVLDGFLYPGHSARRMHAVPEHTGAALMAALERTATAAGADILTGALVRELWLGQDNRVIGVGFERADHRMEHIACDAVILACNGFGGNATMVRELLPTMAQASFGGHVGNDGSAIAWGRALGARLADLQAYQGHGSWVTPQGALMTWAFVMEGGVQINAEGRRFHDETQGYSEAAEFVLKQPGGIAWNVFDGPLLELVRTFPDFVEAEKAGALRTAEDVEALSALIGCDAPTLRQTLEAVAPGQPDQFGRRFKRSLSPPYYAVKVTGALFHTQGGLDIDARCRVLQGDGQPIPNLLAAGGAARGVSGNAVWGYLSGNGLLSAIGGGWVAAGTVVEQLTA